MPDAPSAVLPDFDCASFPASISTWFAVTTIAAICASFGPADCADTPEDANAKRPAAINTVAFM
jgi:hypothetical protein